MIYLFGIIMLLILYVDSEAKFLTGTKITACSTVFPNFKVDYSCSTVNQFTIGGFQAVFYHRNLVQL